MAAETKLTELTVVLIACFASNNRLTPAELPALISTTYQALREIDVGCGSSETPAVPVAD